MPEFTGGHDLIVTTEKLHPVTFKKRGTKKTPVSDHETLINSRIIHRLLYVYRLLHLPSLRDTTALDLRFTVTSVIVFFQMDHSSCPFTFIQFWIQASVLGPLLLDASNTLTPLFSLENPPMNDAFSMSTSILWALCWSMVLCIITTNASYLTLESAALCQPLNCGGTYLYINSQLVTQVSTTQTSDNGFCVWASEALWTAIVSSTSTNLWT